MHRRGMSHSTEHLIYLYETSCVRLLLRDFVDMFKDFCFLTNKIRLVQVLYSVTAGSANFSIEHAQ